MARRRIGSETPEGRARESITTGYGDNPAAARLDDWLRSNPDQAAQILQAGDPDAQRRMARQLGAPMPEGIQLEMTGGRPTPTSSPNWLDRNFPALWAAGLGAGIGAEALLGAGFGGGAGASTSAIPPLTSTVPTTVGSVPGWGLASGTTLSAAPAAGAMGMNPLWGVAAEAAKGLFSGLASGGDEGKNPYRGRAGVDPETQLKNFYEMIYTILPSLLEGANRGPQITAQAPFVPGSKLRDPGPPQGGYKGLNLPTDLFPTRTKALSATPPLVESGWRAGMPTGDAELQGARPTRRRSIKDFLGGK